MYHSIITSYWTLPTVLILLGGTLVSAVPLTWTIPAFDPDNDAFVLPESIIPTQYILSLVPDIKSKKFHGEVDILGQTDDTGSEVSRVVLNADDIKVKSVQMVDLTDGGKKVEIRDFLIKRIPQWLVVTPVGNLTANSDYQLRIKFEGNFGIEAGMYHASYDDDYTKIGGDVVLTEFQTTYARKVFPCWDEPKYKASFIIKVARYPDQISLSNMPLKSTSVPDPHEDNRVWDTFEESPDMSTYLVAVVVADLVSISDPERNLSIWTQPDAAAQQGAQYGLNLTGRLMDQMEQWTAIDYTLPKLDQVALPKLRHQAMEHWGVIAFSERFLVVDDMDSLKQKQQVAFHICHELAHQWFGNLVTMEWWNQVWLNEGFAEFFQYFLLDMLEPSWRLMDIFVVNEVQSMLTHDAFLFTHPVTLNKVRSVVDIEKVFDSVSYLKGGALVRMLYHIMTPDLFQKAIRDYLQQNSLKSVTEDDLWDSLGSVQNELELDLPTDIAEIMYFWTHEAGFPLLMVERDEDGSINLTQKRFLMTNSSGEQSAKSPRWWIPLSYTTSTELDFNDTRPREWFNVSNDFHQVEINLDDDEWIMFNIQLAGFYRVNYDPHTWNLLIDDMISCEFADIHPLNRAQLLDDAFTLASAGYLNYTTALNLSQYLAHETDIIPWTTAFDIFKTLEAKLIGTPARPLFRRYIQMLVSNWYSSLSFDDDTTPECDTSQLTRMTVVALACGFGHHGCVDRALKQVYLLMSEAETQIPTDLEDILLCTAVNAGPEEVWQFVRKQYMSTTSRKKRESYLEAMACSQDPSKIMQMLEDSLDVKSEFFKNNEGNTLIGALVRRKTNSETMLNFFYKNAEEISALYGPEDLQNYFMFATLHMNPIQIDELHSFMEGKMKQLNLTGINKVFSIEKYISTMKQTEVNTWYASYYHDIYRWLLQENETLETESTVDTTLSTRPIDTSTQHIDSTTTIDTTKISTLDYVTEDYESTTDNGMSGAGEGEIDYDDDDNEDDDDDDSEDGGEEKEEKHEEEWEKEIDSDEVGKQGESASASGLRSMLRTVMLVPVLCIVVFS